MVSDSIEYAEWETGERMEGVTFALTKLIGKISVAAISALTMFMLGVGQSSAGRMRRIE